MLMGGRTKIGAGFFGRTLVQILDATNPAAPTVTEYAHHLPHSMEGLAGVKFVDGNGDDAVVTVGAQNNGDCYKSVLTPPGPWTLSTHLNIGPQSFSWAICFRREETWCAFTREFNTDPDSILVHKFNPDGPPYWTKMPYMMQTTWGRTQTIFYGLKERTCC